MVFDQVGKPLATHTIAKAESELEITLVKNMLAVSALVGLVMQTRCRQNL